MNKYIFLNLVGILVLFLGGSTALAQNVNQLLIYWQASSFVPYDFEGRILPTVGSEIIISFDFIKNKKLVDLSKNKILWYVGDELISNAVGVQKIKIIAPPPAGSNINIRVEIPDFNILKTIEIPVVKPKMVINVPFPNKEIKTNYFELYAYPYFFNLPDSDLDYLEIRWLINGQNATSSFDDPLKLKINVTATRKQNITIEVMGTNLKNQFENARQKVNISIIK